MGQRDLMAVALEKIAAFKEVLSRYRDAGRCWVILMVPPSKNHFTDVEDLLEIATDLGWDANGQPVPDDGGSVVLFKIKELPAPRRRYPQIEVVEPEDLE